jgi:hypothetical protein
MIMIKQNKSADCLTLNHPYHGFTVFCLQGKRHNAVDRSVVTQTITKRLLNGKDNLGTGGMAVRRQVMWQCARSTPFFAGARQTHGQVGSGSRPGQGEWILDNTVPTVPV